LGNYTEYIYTQRATLNDELNSGGVILQTVPDKWKTCIPDLLGSKYKNLFFYRDSEKKWFNTGKVEQVSSEIPKDFLINILLYKGEDLFKKLQEELAILEELARSFDEDLPILEQSFLEKCNGIMILNQQLTWGDTIYSLSLNNTNKPKINLDVKNH